MLLADWEGTKAPPFLLFKSAPAKTDPKKEANKNLRNGFGVTVWKEIRALQEEHKCHIYGNKAAWWNHELSLTFLEFNFADRENPDENVLLIWDDFSGHWTADVLAYAASLNVILVKVPPKYTYVCQPADVSWNKPFKTALRKCWVDRLRNELVKYRADEKIRERNREALGQKIMTARKELIQVEADEEVARLREEYKEEPFKLTAPNRVDITQWVVSCWNALTTKTIVGGFARVGILNDTRSCDNELHSDEIESDIVEELEKCRLAGDEICSDDDISDGSSSDSGEDE